MYTFLYNKIYKHGFREKSTRKTAFLELYSIKPNKHDRYVQQLVRQLRPDYDDISTHLKLERKKRLIGEIDVVARRGKELHLFEVKCSHRIVKAKKQLFKLKKIFSHYETTCYFYCGAGNKLVEIC